MGTKQTEQISKNPAKNISTRTSSSSKPQILRPGRQKPNQQFSWIDKFLANYRLVTLLSILVTLVLLVLCVRVFNISLAGSTNPRPVQATAYDQIRQTAAYQLQACKEAADKASKGNVTENKASDSSARPLSATLQDISRASKFALDGLGGVWTPWPNHYGYSRNDITAAQISPQIAKITTPNTPALTNLPAELENAANSLISLSQPANLQSSQNSLKNPENVVAPLLSSAIQLRAQAEELKYQLNNHGFDLENLHDFEPGAGLNANLVKIADPSTVRRLDAARYAWRAVGAVAQNESIRNFAIKRADAIQAMISAAITQLATNDSDFVDPRLASYNLPRNKAGRLADASTLVAYAQAFLSDECVLQAAGATGEARANWLELATTNAILRVDVSGSFNFQPGLPR